MLFCLSRHEKARKQESAQKSVENPWKADADSGSQNPDSFVTVISDVRGRGYESDVGSIEFNNGGAEPLTSFMMHVRAGAEIVPLIVTLCQRQGWSALDCSTGELLEHSAEPEAGLKAWQAYRDKVIPNDGTQ